MGWWEDLGSWAQEITGVGASRRAELDEANVIAQGQQALEAQRRLMGMSEANTEQTAQDQARQANIQAQQAGQQAGLNPAQAAMLAGQATGGTYTQAKQAADAQKVATLQAAAGVTPQAQANTNPIPGASAMMQGGSMVAKAYGASDENLKDNVEEVSGVSDIAEEIPAVEFNYKEDSGENPDPKRVGILAQDLEKTPLAYTVENTPKGKMVNTAQLTLANTAMISDLSKKLDRIFKDYEGML